MVRRGQSLTATAAVRRFPAPDGRQVEIAFSSFGRLRDRMAEQATAGIVAIAEFLSEARVIYSANPDVPKLRSEARALLRRQPPPLAEHELAWRAYEIWNQSKDVEDRLEDPVAAYYLSFLAYWNLVSLYFRLTRRWLPRPKAVFSTIRDIDPDMYALSRRYTRGSSAPARYRVIRQLMEALSQRFGVKFERYYTSPPVSKRPTR